MSRVCYKWSCGAPINGLNINGFHWGCFTPKYRLKLVTRGPSCSLPVIPCEDRVSKDSKPKVWLEDGLEDSDFVYRKILLEEAFRPPNKQNKKNMLESYKTNQIHFELNPSAIFNITKKKLCWLSISGSLGDFHPVVGKQCKNKTCLNLKNKFKNIWGVSQTSDLSPT